MLLEKSPDADDRKFLETTIGMLSPLKTDIERLLASKNILKRKPGYDSRCHHEFKTTYVLFVVVAVDSCSYQTCLCLALMLLDDNMDIWHAHKCQYIISRGQFETCCGTWHNLE